MLRLFWSGIIWHYTVAYKEILTLSRNFIWFIFHLFSIKDLSKTLFYPWQRLGERYQGGFNIGAWFSTFILNTLMRMVGFFARITVILIGMICVVAIIVISGLFLIVWTLIPIILIFLFVTSIRLFLE